MLGKMYTIYMPNKLLSLSSCGPVSVKLKWRQSFFRTSLSITPRKILYIQYRFKT